MVKTEGLKIDYDNIGTGIYDMLDDKDKAVVAFGMIPKWAVDMASNLFREKTAKLKLKELGIDDPDEEMIENLKKAVKPKFVSEFEHHLTISILNRASHLGKMIA